MLDRLAEKNDAKATWEQIVLPQPASALLQRIAAQVRGPAKIYYDWGFRARMNRALGVSVLFAGDTASSFRCASPTVTDSWVTGPLASNEGIGPVKHNASAGVLPRAA